jgi:hypothetical protein
MNVDKRLLGFVVRSWDPDLDIPELLLLPFDHGATNRWRAFFRARV